MKNILASFIVLLSCMVATAQVQPGLKAGLNLSNFGGSDNDGFDMKTGFYVGGQVEIKIARTFYIQPEAQFSLQGAKFSEDGVDGKINLSYLNIPVLAKVKTDAGLFFESGPQIGFLMSAKIKAEGESVDAKEIFKSNDISWIFGLGYQVGSIGIGARYNMGVSNIADMEGSELKNTVIQIGISYSFGKK